jgi:hypothetical protein
MLVNGAPGFMPFYAGPKTPRPEKNKKYIKNQKIY